MQPACTSSGIITTAIEGVVTYPLKQIPTESGPVLHMLRADNPLFVTFGELYFSQVDAHAVKAWKRHSRQTQLFAVPWGKMKIVMYDARPHSPSHGRVLQQILGRPNDYQLLRIPYGIWYGFTALGGQPALLANFADIPHDPQEAERLPANTTEIPFQFV